MGFAQRVRQTAFGNLPSLWAPPHGFYITSREAVRLQIIEEADQKKVT